MLAYFSVGVVYNCTEAAFFRMMTPVWMFLTLAITGAMVLANHSIRLPVDGDPDHEEDSASVGRCWCLATFIRKPGVAVKLTGNPLNFPHAHAACAAHLQ